MPTYARRAGTLVHCRGARDTDPGAGVFGQCDEAGERVPEGVGSFVPDDRYSLPVAHAGDHNSAHGQH
jgi:hypothetical protein